MFSRKYTTIACAAALAALSCGAQAQISGGSVKIGVLTDLSGTYSDLAGSGAVLATRMAIDDFIAKGARNCKPKPMNLWRKLKIRKRIGYWGRART